MRKPLLICIIFFLTLVLLSACNNTAFLQPTLTFSGDGCSYKGPTTIDSNFVLTWIIKDTGHSGYIYAIVLLDTGKTIDDLEVIPAEEPGPEWMHKLVYGLEMMPGKYSKQVDLDANLGFQEGGIFFVCFVTDGDNAIGAIGPIQVKK